MESERNAIVVYGASSEGINQKYKDAAYRLGELIAGRGLTLVSGGGKAGLMKAAIEGATSCGGRTVGVLPRFMVDRNWQHPLLTAAPWPARADAALSKSLWR